ncbi:MAG: protein-L-isoaspartate O-methyltransferase, partial [Pseudomonadota bacterium]|nr:protein-L-isoaspartate O-methyltransferase [Pseudomonadota bacterium]
MNIEQARSNMIEQQLRCWEVLNDRVLKVLGCVPRECFVSKRYRNLAFADLEIRLGHGQSMMTPKVEGRMLQALNVQPTDRVLEIGTGSGFITACLARLCREVESVDIFTDFTQCAQLRLAGLGLRNVNLSTGDGACGWRQAERFNAIAVTGSSPEYRACFEQQLAIGGRLFAIVGERPAMSAMHVVRTGEREYLRRRLFETGLAPLLNVKKMPVFTL